MNHDEGLREIALKLERDINSLFEAQLGFALIVFPYGAEPRGCDYISNATRDNMVLALREAADQIEKGKDIPTPIGSA